MITLELDDRTLHIESAVLETAISAGAAGVLHKKTGLQGMIKTVLSLLVNEIATALRAGGHTVPDIGRGEHTIDYASRLIARLAVVQLDGDYAATIEHRNGSEFLVGVQPLVSDDSD